MNNEVYLIPVSDRIKDAVIKFINDKLASGDPTFTSSQLRFHVANNVAGKVSPGSPDRVLRDLRSKGRICYYVQNRGRSLYKALPFTPPPTSGYNPGAF